MHSDLYASLFGHPEITSLVSDERFIAEMLVFEAALAKVEGALGIIPSEAAEHIMAAAAVFKPDTARLEHGVDLGGVPTIALIKQLREQVGGESASYVHWGATSQDVMDTALALQLRAIITLLEDKLKGLIRRLAAMAAAHRHSLMPGRTHSQHALPITFGLKVAGWLSPLLRHHERLQELKPRLLVLQLGGAAGTLASLGNEGLRVQAALAQELGLGLPLSTWHTQRDTLAELAGWLSLVTGGLAKMAQDLILMAQSEVDEIRETDDPARGGSSTMPQKRNPIISEVIIAIARSNAAHLSTLHQALIQEHERATGGWQMEWLALPQMLILTGAALEKALLLSETLVVNTEQMRRNLADSHGLLLAEALDLALAPYIGRTEAKQMVKTAAQIALENHRHLVDVVREQIDLPLDWERLRDEGHYLGVTQAMINRVLDAVKEAVGSIMTP